MKKNEIRSLTIAAMLLALGITLPTMTGPQLGSIILPMHIPALLCGLILGPKWGLLVGFTTPLLRSVTFGMPPLLPAATAMAFEIGAYGLIAGLLYHSKRLPKNPVTLYGALIAAMLGGRLVFGAAMYILLVGLGLGPGVYSFTVWFTSVFVRSATGIAIQLVLIPLIVLALQKSGYLKFNS